MPCILALDQGTTSSRAIAFDAGGCVVAVAQREFAQHYPKAGWVEHDATEIWRTQHDVACEVVEALGQRGESITALGVTNQRETTVIWDRATGETIHHAIVWQDRRTADRIDALKARGYDAMLRHKTGLVPDAYFSASKVQWLLQHIDGAHERAVAGELAFGTIDSWLIYNLTGGAVHVTDVTNASRTMLYDIHAQQWDDELLALFDVPRAMLPRVRASSEVIGEVTIDSPLRGLPIAGVAGDQQAALVGQLCTQPGMTKNTYGTGCFTLMHTGDKAVRSGNNLLTTIAWRIGDSTAYALEGSVFIGGAVVQWLRDGLGVIERSSDVESLAASVTDSDGVYFVPAFAGLGAPHWDAYARGTICGLTRGTTAAHLARAAIESIAFQVADLLKAMEADGEIELAELRADGGAAGDDLLLQFQADLLGKPIVRPRVTETTALGAAYLAGLATGLWRNWDDLAGQWQVDRRFEPKMSRDEAAARTARWRRAVDSARGWAR